MYNPVSFLENDTHKLLWNFDIYNGSPNLGQKTRPYNNQQKKKRTCKIVDFAVPADHRIKLKVCKKKNKYLVLARELKKTMEHEGDNYTNCDWCFWYNKYRIIKWTGGLGIWRTSGDHPNYHIIEYGLNTAKTPGNLRRLAVTQLPRERPSAKTDVKNSL